MATSVYNDQMFNLGGAAVTSLTSMNAGTSSTAGPYSPQADGTLLTITIYIAPQAVGGNILALTRAVNQPVDTSLAITGQVIYFFSPVTPNIVVEGTFQG